MEGKERKVSSSSTTLYQFFCSFSPHALTRLLRVYCASPVCLKENGKGLLLRLLFYPEVPCSAKRK